MAAQEKTKAIQKGKGKYILFAVEIVIILVMLLVVIIVWNLDDYNAPNADDWSKADKGIDESAQSYMDQFKEPEIVENEDGTITTIERQGYMNIALFGVDARKDSELFKSSRSDTIMIASINLDTGDIKLVSLYRDTYLNIGDNDYRKCNAAYSFGGAEQAVKMLNTNLDMDITDFITVGYKGLSEVIDGLGGVYIDVDSEEITHINNYQMDVASVLKTDYTPVKEPGYQLLNGLQATAYCRIRYTAGSDFKRTTRQREVIMAIEEQAKKADLATLTKVFNSCINDIYTSIDTNDILTLLGSIKDYRIVADDGFPQSSMRGNANIDGKGSCEVPKDLEDCVVWLHEFLFDDATYKVSATVKEHSKAIKEQTAKYLQK